MMTFLPRAFLLPLKRRFLAVEASFLRFCQNEKNSSTNLQNFGQLLQKLSEILGDKISKMRILEPKNAFWKGAKKHEIKKASNQKMTVIKVDQNFTN